MKSIKDEFGLYREEFFDDMLQRERKRAERTLQPFTLIMVAVKNLLKTEGSSSVRKLSSILDESFREIDIQGWYRRRAIIGIICFGVPQNNIPTLQKKLESTLKETFSSILTDELAVSYICFPEHTSDENNDDAHLCMYPEFKKNSVKKIAENITKRIMDITLAGTAVVLLFPLFIIIAIVIKTTSSGPVFFKQKRVGFCGKPFTFLKFRSMKVNNDESEHKAFVKKFITTSDTQTTDTPQTFKIVNDVRITPVGKFLRKTSLDELPQLINVLIGNMSLVGPRPPIPYEVDEYRMWHRRRVMEVKPGITGFWQVHGRSKTTFENMVRMDIFYIKSRSLLLDIKLLIKTTVSLFKGAH